MERDPTLFPEWYKPSGSNGASGGGASSNRHCRLSSNSDDRNSSWLHPKNKSSTSGLRRDKYESTAFDSLRRGSSSNGSVSHGATHLRSNSSLGRSRRDRESDRLRGRVLENGFSGSLKSSRAEIDSPRRSSSSVLGQQADSLSRRPGKDVSNGVHSGGSRIASKASFERDFPSLGADHNQGHESRVSSTGPRTAFESLPVGPSAIGGGDGWTSSLAEIPARVGSNGSGPSSSLQNTPVSLPSTGLSTSMAEALAQPPPQDRNAPQVSVDTRRIEELARIQSTKLIPVMPSMSKHSILNSDKSKSKSAKDVHVSGLPKLGQQFSSQLPIARSAPQAGNFKVLNRERNGMRLVSKDGPMPVNRAPTPLTHVPSATPLKIPIIPNAQAVSKANIATSAGEKRSSQARNRSAFFNSLRKQSSANQSAATESNCVSSTNSVEACQQSDGISLSSNQEDSSLLSRGLSSISICDDSQEPLEFDDDLTEDEKAFLESLGWEKDAQVEVLTAEEIDAFVKEHGLVRQSSRRSHHDLGSVKTEASSSSNSQ